MHDGAGRPSPSVGRSVSKILFLLTHKEKVRLFLVLGALLINGLVDVLGASSILPFIAVVAKPSMVETNVYLKQVYVWSGAGSVNEFLFYLGVLTLVIAVAEQSLRLAVHWAILRFSHGLGYSLSQRVIKMYLRQPYAFFLDRNSATLTLNATGEVGRRRQWRRRSVAAIGGKSSRRCLHTCAGRCCQSVPGRPVHGSRRRDSTR